MKIYVTNINKHEIQESLLNKYKCKTEHITLILSNLGLITSTENKLVLNKIVDKPIEKREVNGFNFLCDNSYFTKDRVIYQVPVPHVSESIIRTHYKLNDKSSLTAIIEKNKDMVDIYFETIESMDVEYIKADILSFLTELKFC